MKQIIEAGHTPNSPGAIGYDNITEYTRNKDLQKRVLKWLEYFKINAEGLQGSTMGIAGIDKALNEVVRKLNTKPKGSRFVSIHFNNNFHNATGTEVFVSPHTSQLNIKRAEWIAKNIADVLNIPIRREYNSRNYKYSHEANLGRLAIIDDTKLAGVLVEVCFLNDIDIPKYTGNQDKIAYVLALALMHGFQDAEPEYSARHYEKLERIKFTNF